MVEPKTFLEAFDYWHSVQPKKSAFAFVDHTSDIIQSFTYDELHIRSQHLARKLLTDFKVSTGERVLLVYPPSLDFMVAFIACLRSGVIAVPVFPPDPFHAKRDMGIFKSIQKSSGSKIALTSSQYYNALKFAELKSLITGNDSLIALLKWECTDTLKEGSSDIELPNDSSRSSLAFLQYTSGSTSEPKGVMISHGNLAHNLKLIITGLKAVEDTVVVSWLPQYHDMGLIGSYLGALYCGGCGYYLSPMTFIKNPVLWIHCMSKFRATHVQAPNFAYSLVAKKFLSAMKSNPSLTKDLNLSSLRHMINAAEPVDVASIEMFYAVFEKYGLHRGVIYPTYGLAEHTVYVCSNGEQSLVVDKLQLEAGKVVVAHAGKHTTTIIGCGKPTDSNGVDLKIVEPSTGNVLSEDKVGEIWINSPSKAQGYWSLPDRTKEDFGATLSGADDVGYLRTGDLGFLHKGEVFICGRLKDTIIIRGKNYYPHDIEKTGENFTVAEVSLELRKGCSAALGITIMGNEVVLYIAEVTDQVVANKSALSSAEYFVEKLRAEINNMNGVSVAYIALLPPRTIPKTSSGKIARQWVKRSYFEGNLPSLFIWSNLDSVDCDIAQHQDLIIESISPDIAHSEKIDPTGMPLSFILEQLRQVVASCSGSDISSVDVKIPLSRLGLDSMQGIQLQTQLESKFTVLLPDELLFDPDATLTTIGNSLINGGTFHHRPVMIEGKSVHDAFTKKHISHDTIYFKVLMNIINTLLLNRPWRYIPPTSKVRETMTPQWYKENEVKADIDTLRFPNSSATKVLPIKWTEESNFMFYSLQIFGIFFYFPVLAWAIHHYLSMQSVVLFWTILLLVIFGINHEEWPPAFRGHPSFGNVLKYFSYRMIIEAPVSAYEGHTSIYTFGPHGVFGIAPTIQTMINGMVVGEYFHLLGANAIFKVPFYNTLLQMLGFQSVDRNNMTTLLNKGRSVGIIPGGIAEMFVTSENEETLVVQDRKGFISVGLETGAQIVPCYCFGNTRAFRAYNSPFLQSISRMLRMSVILFWGRWGTPAAKRVPMMTVIGKPIILPKVDKPSAELINEYHELFLREIRRLYDTYKNTYDWQDHKLVFKR